MKSVSEAIHDAVQKLSPFDEAKTRAKVGMGQALEAKALQSVLRSRPGMRVIPNIYAGTANPNTVAKRRTKNKVAKKSRKANR